ncbi:MAG: NHL repeat-containing protein [Planctomycetes bacterium]|nr:NHL repeat-containing protein [Planctomycetota bacterium]
MLRHFICAVTLSVFFVVSQAAVHADLFISNEGDASIRRFTAAGVPVGSGEFVAPGAGGMIQPRAIAFGPDGDLYVGDFNSAGGIYRFDGSTGAPISGGVFVAPGSGGLGSTYQFDWGPDGNLYVADFNNNRVLRYDGSTGASLGVFGQASSAGPASLTPVEGLQWGPDGNLYVGSRNDQRVVQFDGAGNYLGTFGEANATDSDLHEASSLRFFGNTLYVVDQNNTSDVIKRYDLAGNYLGGFTSGDNITNATDGLFGEDGNYLVAKYGSIRRFDGTTGVYLDNLIDAPTGGLDSGVWLAITPQEEPNGVPEPSAFVLAALGLAGLGVLAWRRSKGNQRC